MLDHILRMLDAINVPPFDSPRYNTSPYQCSITPPFEPPFFALNLSQDGQIFVLRRLSIRGNRRLVYWSHDSRSAIDDAIDRTDISLKFEGFFWFIHTPLEIKLALREYEAIIKAFHRLVSWFCLFNFILSNIFLNLGIKYSLPYQSRLERI